MTKSEARELARLRAASIPPASRDLAGEAIARLVWTVPEVAAARVLLLYASLSTEVHTDAIAEEARRRGITVVYPRCLIDTREMSLHSVESAAALGAAAYGIREPAADCPLVQVGEIDAALVPGLAWDRSGARLGRGAGYFDRLFAHPGWRGFRCGLFLAEQELSSLPTDAWDAGLDAVVTEREVWRREVTGDR